ncbi:uncharacterized protein LOC114183942 isoform X2 [Vigna unguiculata]|uniref:uncharacterized protein LOC114183942 isoform X2 n=1 Tax=Vigna unguiculata TaxID=3917 RepID=UPI001016882F|nr:uncharacterized protein LOC114183942 isoform X2 [Vigna unguiculata]
MRSLLLEATITKIYAKRMKRRYKKRHLSKKCYEDLPSIPSLLLETIRRRYSAKCSKRIRKRKRELEKEYYADWSSLPRGILEMIAEKLTFIDCLSISKVCMSWNAILGEELPSWQRHGFPCLLVSGQQNKETRTCISILENRVWELELAEANGMYCWGSFRGWLIMVKNLDYFYLEINLLNPFSGSQISLPSVWNFYHKIVPSGLPSENNFVCMLLHSQCRELTFWVTGANSWRKYNKLTEIETRFHEVKRPEMFELQEGGILHNRHTSQILRYLVESCGELLLVCRYFSPNQHTVIETQKFEVFALDFCQLSWKKVEDLGDQMIFLGKCCSTSFSAKELGVGIKNSIYFCNDPTIPWWNEWDSDHLKGISSRLGFNQTNVNNWGIFTLGNEDGEPFCFHGDIINWAYTWFTVPSWWCYRNIPPIRSN